MTVPALRMSFQSQSEEKDTRKAGTAYIGGRGGKTNERFPNIGFAECNLPATTSCRRQ